MKQSRKHYSLFSRVRVIALLFSFPAFISGCLSAMDDSSNPASPERLMDKIAIDTKSITAEATGTADIFIFEDNPLGRLDSYRQTKINTSDNYTITAYSSSGPKKAVILANYNGNRRFPQNTHSYECLTKVISRLQDEDIANPAMCGETVCFTGKNIPHTITLRPFISEIRLNTIRCDFSGTEYEGERMKNIKVYLINVNTECKVLQENGFKPSGIINAGRLCEDDLRGFKQSDLVLKTIDKSIGANVYKPDIKLYCYPNESTEETLGTPFTRLVIEGEINGKIWYYPININRQEGQNGIGRNCSYIYNITILRTGSDSPDKPVCEHSIITDCRPIPWEERNDEELTF